MTYDLAERSLIERILDSADEDAPRLDYADWLERRGDTRRSKIVRATCPGRIDLDALEAGLSELGHEHYGWSRLVGAQLVRAACLGGFQRFVSRWLRLARPAFELTIGEPRSDAPLGASRLWGDPDMPPGKTEWPTLAHCRRWQPEIDLPPDSPCQFIAQIHLAEISASPAARMLPKHGLISVFAHHEWARTASSSVCLRYFRSTQQLQRISHPATEPDNARTDAHEVLLREALTIPDCYGSPFAQNVGIDDGDWDTIDKYHEVLLASGGGLLGLLGHDRSTSGDDPTPGKEWERLITVPIDRDAVVVQHLASRQSDMKAGRLEAYELVWVDFDT